MSERGFNKVGPELWRSRRLRSASHLARLVHAYLLTNAHVNSIGCYELPDGYACDDLEMGLENYVALRAELVEVGLVDFDEEHSVVFIDKWFDHNPLTNQDHIKGARRRLEAIGSEGLKVKATAAFEVALARFDEKQAEKDAKRRARANGASEVIGDTARLLNTNLMRRDKQ